MMIYKIMIHITCSVKHIICTNIIITYYYLNYLPVTTENI